MEEYVLEAMKYFTVEDWTKLDGSEQMKYGQILYIYYACTHLGIIVATPVFMLTKESAKDTAIEKKMLTNKCKYCQVTFALAEYKIKHMKICKKRFDFVEIKKTFSCDQCTYTTDYSKCLRLHKMTHTKEKNYVCQYCQKAFLQKSHLQSHIKIIHLNAEKKFNCQQCSYKTNYSSALKRHEKTHSNVKTFVCDICFEGFHRKDRLTQHSYKHNNKERPFKCLQCQKGYFNKKELEKHTDSAHLKIKRFKCNTCEYSSVKKISLNKHILTHLQSKLFECNLCSYRCSSNGNLKKHLKKEHKDYIQGESVE